MDLEKIFVNFENSKFDEKSNFDARSFYFVKN